MLVDSASQFVQKSYDYVIIGGGTAGLTLAARLTEEKDVSVGVIEAGKDRMADPNIAVPGLAANLDGNADYDWNFETKAQEALNARVLVQPRGKVLGGSSAINFLMCTYPSKSDIDNWAGLGNAGWSFQDMKPYYKKFEGYTPPPKDIAAYYGAGIFVEPALHDGNGPLKVGFPHNKRLAAHAWLETFEEMGLKTKSDPKAGFGNGGYSNLSCLDAAAGTRSHAATAYYAPNASRPNLTVLTDALVSKIDFDIRNGVPHASRVAFVSNGKAYHVVADKEVLLCAGTFQSPHILELSGIGSEEILKEHDIKVLVKNPNVGENLQDHAVVPLCWAAAAGEETFDELQIAGATEKSLEDFYADQDGLLTAKLTSVANLSHHVIRTSKDDHEACISRISEVATKNVPYSGVVSLKKQYELLVASLQNPEDTTAQYLVLLAATQIGSQLAAPSTTEPGEFITLYGTLSHPFSRGTVHLRSKNPNDPPIIDPRYLSHPLDVEIMGDAVLFMQSIATTQPFASKLLDNGQVFHRGYERQTKETVGDFMRNSLQTEYHPVGTCAMMPREQGGVVNTKLEVYGVTGLRVADASVIPLEVRNNIQSSVYAIAEKAAEIIKADSKLRSV